MLRPPPAPQASAVLPLFFCLQGCSLLPPGAQLCIQHESTQASLSSSGTYHAPITAWGTENAGSCTPAVINHKPSPFSVSAAFPMRPVSQNPGPFPLPGPIPPLTKRHSEKPSLMPCKGPCLRAACGNADAQAFFGDTCCWDGDGGALPWAEWSPGCSRTCTWTSRPHCGPGGGDAVLHLHLSPQHLPITGQLPCKCGAPGVPRDFCSDTDLISASHGRAALGFPASGLPFSENPE